MPDKTEQIAVEILKALKAEREREPSLLQCRTIDAVIRDSKVLAQFTDEQLQSAIKLITSNGLMDGTNRDDGLAAQPNELGDAFLSGVSERQEKEKAAQFKRRVAAITLILAVLTFIFGVIKWLMGGKD